MASPRDTIIGVLRRQVGRRRTAEDTADDVLAALMDDGYALVPAGQALHAAQAAELAQAAAAGGGGRWRFNLPRS